jgi:RNA polymerase sigma factor (sigma-70 family)
VPDTGRLGALMKRVQEGDAGAYAALLDSLIPLLRRLVRRRRWLAGPHDADDLVQDILLAMHRARATYDPARPFLPWLLAIARHRTAESARQQVRRTSHEVVVEDLDVTFQAATTNFLMSGYRDPQALKHALGHLPSKQRTAIELLKLRGLSLKAAASATGTSVGALKVATHRAMIALRKMLK